MRDLYWLTDEQMVRLEPYFPKSHGKPWVDDRRVLSGIFFVKYDKRRYQSRSRIEIMFGRLKDWRRVATRSDRCPTVFFSTIALTATVIFWL